MQVLTFTLAWPTRAGQLDGSIQNTLREICKGGLK